jgi:hypothetical protein
MNAEDALEVSIAGRGRKGDALLATGDRNSGGEAEIERKADEWATSPEPPRPLVEDCRNDRLTYTPHSHSIIYFYSITLIFIRNFLIARRTSVRRAVNSLGF